MVKYEVRFPISKVIEVPKTDIVYTTFGIRNYLENIKRMEKSFFQNGEKRIPFRPATVSESILIAAHNFKRLAKPEIFDTKFLQAGKSVLTKDGVFINTSETDIDKIKCFFNGTERIHGVYFVGDVTFAPYESFEQGIQEAKQFVEGGLARALEHTPEKIAGKLKEMTSPKLYTDVQVLNFGQVQTPTKRIITLYSYDERFIVGNNKDNNHKGYAFGVLNK